MFETERRGRERVVRVAVATEEDHGVSEGLEARRYPALKGLADLLDRMLTLAAIRGKQRTYRAARQRNRSSIISTYWQARSTGRNGLVVIHDGTARSGQSEDASPQLRRYSHSINRPVLYNGVVPYSPEIVVSAAVRSLLKVVVQRRVEHAELWLGRQLAINRVSSDPKTCVPRESRYFSRSPIESFQNSPTANSFGLLVFFRTCLTNFEMNALSMCCATMIDVN